MPLTQHAKPLDALYGAYNRREFVHPDPLEFLYGYDDPLDREVVGLIAASLAYGRVKQILASVSRVLDRLGESPAKTLVDARSGRFEKTFADFRHRFQTGKELSSLLRTMQRAIKRHGSLGACFQKHVEAARGEKTVGAALAGWVAELSAGPGEHCGHLLPDPAKGSACKRLNLYLRWMVRQDAVDPGGWEAVGRERLIVPLDTHMHRIGRTLGATRRAAADGRAAEELTAAFRRLCPDDPVKYDFSLTRLGIRADADLDGFLAECGLRNAEHA